MINGIIIVNKETGFTSHDVVAKLRGICGQKKIGHTGTLDPAATGVLPVCLGSGTKLCDMLTDRDKEYVAELLLGVETDTQDTTGSVLRESPVTVTEEEVSRACLSFLGDYDQIPPMYSALKVDGKKLYELARAGKEVERKARKVTIEELEIQEMKLPIVTMRVVCPLPTCPACLSPHPAALLPGIPYSSPSAYHTVSFLLPDIPGEPPPHPDRGFLYVLSFSAYRFRAALPPHHGR